MWCFSHPHIFVLTYLKSEKKSMVILNLFDEKKFTGALSLMLFEEVTYREREKIVHSKGTSMSFSIV